MTDVANLSGVDAYTGRSIQELKNYIDWMRYTKKPDLVEIMLNDYAFRKIAKAAGTNEITIKGIPIRKRRRNNWSGWKDRQSSLF